MKIELKEVSVSDVVFGYLNSNEEGVFGLNGLLNIRPPYQREFIYKDKQREAVITTVRKDFPLNVMYWITNDDGTFEVLDGQQRTISICEYAADKFSYNFQYFHNLTPEEQQQILDYKLMIYFCEGNDKEKLDWFKTINIAGEKLSNQELRNAVYTGPWLSDAKKYFSKTGCAAYNMASDYIRGTPIRQDYLETAIEWIENGDVEGYMAKYQKEPNANELWLYFQKVIQWVKIVFPNTRKEMKGLNWGDLYNKFGNEKFNSNILEEKIVEMMMDDEITNKKGIYIYLLTDEEKHLNIRSFTSCQRREAYERQKGICAVCGEKFDIEDMEADHITPWSEGGKTYTDNCQMLCKEDNRRKSNK